MSNPSDEEMKASIEAFQNRKIYSRLTNEIINSTPDDNLCLTVTDTIHEIIGYDDDECEKFQNLTLAQKFILAVWVVEAEVNNGGFDQFYFNSSKQYSDIAVTAFMAIGAPKFAALMEKANQIYLSIKDELDKYDDGTVESFSASYKDNPLNELDTQFYNLYLEEELDKLCVSYIRSHVSEFTK